jgi:hypothetical protein
MVRSTLCYITPPNLLGERGSKDLSKYLPIVITVVGTVAAAVGLPALVASHPVVFAALNAAAMVLHAVLPSVFGVGAGK